MYETSGSTATRNKKRLKGSLCLTLLAKMKERVIKPFTMIDEEAFVLSSTITLINEVGNCITFKTLCSQL